MTTAYKPASETCWQEPMEEDPASYCVFSDPYYATDNFGPQSVECREYMSQRCANKWDSECEVYSKNEDWSVPDHNSKFETGNPTTTGEKHIRNTAERRFCRMVGDQCYEQRYDFNPMSTGTPLVSRWNGACTMVCDQFDPNTVYDDPVFQKCLEHPGLCDHVLNNMSRAAAASAVSSVYPSNSSSSYLMSCGEIEGEYDTFEHKPTPSSIPTEIMKERGSEKSDEYVDQLILEAGRVSRGGGGGDIPVGMTTVKRKATSSSCRGGGGAAASNACKIGTAAAEYVTSPGATVRMVEAVNKLFHGLLGVAGVGMQGVVSLLLFAVQVGQKFQIVKTVKMSGRERDRK